MANKSSRMQLAICFRNEEKGEGCYDMKLLIWILEGVISVCGSMRVASENR